MTGFIRRLFGDKTKPGSEPIVEPPKPTQKLPTVTPARQDTGAFFLDTNEARTYGNLEYMQASKRVKRTFPKTADQPEPSELIQEVSAAKRIVNTGKQISVPDSVVKPEGTTQPVIEVKNESADRRRTDTSMDMFRNMARDIRK